MVMCTMMSQCNFECDDFDNKYLYPLAAKKEFADSHAHRIKQRKDEDASIQELIK